MYLKKLFYHQLSRLGPYLQSYLHLQLVITLTAWPLLYQAGLPLSPALFLGNLLFAPFLLLFLLLSSLLFFTELLSVPHWPLSSLLELLTTVWWYTLNSGHRSWLFVLTHPPHWVTIVLPLLVLASLLHKQLSRATRIYFFILLIVLAGYLIPRLQGETATQLRFLDKELTLYQSGSQGIIIDPGILGRRLSAPKQITFSLIPQLNKQGVTHLNLIVAKPSIMVFKSLARLVESFPVGAIYLPSFTGTLKNNGWHAWEQLLKNTQQYQTKIILVTKPATISLGTKAITITPEKEPITRNNLTYHQLTQHVSQSTYETPSATSDTQHP